MTRRKESATLLPPSALLLVIFVSTSLCTDTNTDMYDIILYTILQQQVKHLSRKSSQNTAGSLVGIQQLPASESWRRSLGSGVDAKSSMHLWHTQYRAIDDSALACSMADYSPTCTEPLMT